MSSNTPITTKAAITGVGAYLPNFILKNEYLEKMVDTTNDWIVERTGIYERRILNETNKSTSDMATEAVHNLLKKKQIQPIEIDLLICATVTPDTQMPAVANLICSKIGATNAASFDISAACTGFLTALVTASQFIETGKYKKVVVVGADKMSSIIDYTDRATCIIFGDGAGAVLLQPTQNSTLGILDSILGSDGTGKQYLNIKAGGASLPVGYQEIALGEQYVFQEGKTVFRYAVKQMTEVSQNLMQRNQLTHEQIDWLVPHQANKRIIDSVTERLGIDKQKVMINIQKYGNTTAATIPLCLWEWERQVKKNDSLILCAFGGGFTWGAVYLKWAY